MFIITKPLPTIIIGLITNFILAKVQIGGLEMLMSYFECLDLQQTRKFSPSIDFPCMHVCIVKLHK